MKLNYRPDIDGLRALAVLSVLFFHAEFTFNEKILFPGGFLGVDIFFVISGYLITSLLLKEIKINSNINFLNFYERRSRRILPALIVVIVSTLIFGLFFLSSAEYVDLNKSTLSAILFVSNFYFYFAEYSYNHDLSMLKPLLHTWSLSIEEQFYIFFPLAIWIIYKYLKLNLRIFIFLTFFISFLLSIYGSIYHPHFSFYLIPTRAWELLMGALIAQYTIENNQKLHLKSYFLKNIAYLVCLILIFSAILFYNDSFLNKWIFIFISVVSASFLILVGDDSISIKKIFENKFIVKIGLISYSTYLWHFPIFAIARTNNYIGLENLFKEGIQVNVSEEASIILKIILIIVTLIISFFSYTYVEKFFRNFEKVNSKNFFKILFVSLALILLFSSYVIHVDGFKFGKKFKIDNYVLDNTYLKKIIDEQREKNLDRKFITSDKEKVIVVGNSHGIDFFHMLFFNQDLYKNKEFIIYGTQIRCLLRNLKNEALKNPECLSPHKRQDNNINIQNFEDADTIILATRWLDMYDWYAAEHIANYLKNKNKKVFIINNFPEFYVHQNRKGNVIDAYVQRNFLKIESIDSIKEKLEVMAYENIYPPVFDVKREVINVANKTKFEILDPFDFMCDLKNKKCDFLTDNGEKIYYDYGHFTIEGAKYFGKKMYNEGWLK